MSGGQGLRAYLAILSVLEAGPRTKTELKRACGYDVVREYPALDRMLQELRMAGVLECCGKSWVLARGQRVCPTCHGRGLAKAE